MTTCSKSFSTLAPAGLRLGWREIRMGDELALMPEEQAAFEHSVTSVRRRSGAARIVARALLEQDGHPAVAIPRSEAGAPVWPEGIVGSLAHDSDIAVCAIARRSDFAAVGIDVEPDLPMPDDTAAMIPSATEVARYDPELLQSRVLFSIKEAAYKAFYTLDPSFLDFSEIETDLKAGTCQSVRGLVADIRWTRSPRVVTLATVRVS